MERTVLVRYIYDTASAQKAEDLIKRHLNTGWIVEHTEHANGALVIFFNKKATGGTGNDE
jgi:hypothetical protein